jgi:hypothetical protein
MHVEITSYAVKACTFISLNFNFLNSPLSLLLLQALTPLLDRLDANAIMSENLDSSRGPSQVTSYINFHSDLDNCIFAISNLLKGRSQNCVYFVENDGPRQVMEHMLRPSCSEEVLELCLGSIKQLTDSKIIF